MSSNFTTFYCHSGSEDVRIAGNFNNWQTEKLTYDPATKRHIFKIQDKDSKGKYVFKFVIDNVWKIDEDYPTEIDNSHNENNVLYYDHTSDDFTVRDLDNKTVEDELVTSTIQTKTPDPTPANGLSTTASINQVDSIKTEPTNTTSPDKFDLQKMGSEPTSTSDTEIKSIPITSSINSATTTEQIPNPQPVGRPEIPIETSTPPVSSSTGVVPEPKEVDRPEVEIINGDDVDNDDITDDNFGNDTEATYVDSTDHQVETTSRAQSTVAKTNNDDGHYGLGFFAALLHIINQFFRGWFGGN